MVLLELLSRLKPAAHFTVVHFHHGSSPLPGQQAFRDKARALVEEQSRKKNLPFISGESEIVLSSEDEFRTARWQFIKSRKKPGQIVATAHHQDDRLETVLLKLIRGAGSEGLAGFKMWNQEIFRPFLNSAKNEMLMYAETNKLSWVEDPSNIDPQYLRNWLREDWLSLLEARVPGGTANLAKSLDNLIKTSTEIQSFELKFAEDGKALDRQWFTFLSPDEQLRGLALYLRANKIFEFTSGQLTEIRKRLDKNQKDITFDLVGKKWVINATQIMLE